MKIMVVDDNRDNVELVVDILQSTQYEVVAVQESVTAVHIALKEQPDLILLDVNMPILSGFDLIEQIKANPNLTSIPVIMLTAMSDIDSRVHGLALGAEDYLTKPFSARELLARIQRSLKAKQSRDELHESQDKIRLTFERFVAPSIVENLLNNPNQLELGGHLQEVTVLFADLEGFTALSENVSPDALLQVLNAYHTFIVEIVFRYGGTVDKFLGDGLMALYNTPVEQPDHIARAVKTALHIQDEIYWFHEKLEPEYRLKVNFGIHSGVAIVGNVGTAQLMNFTAVGDTVNVASRLQSIAGNGRILVSKPVYEATENFVMGRSRGALSVKGRKFPVDAYQISNSPIDDD